MDGKDQSGNPPRPPRGGGGGARSLLASARAVTPAAALLDGTVFLFDLQRKRREEDELGAEIEEQRPILESLQQRIDELKVKQEAARDLYLNKFLKEGNPDQTAQKAVKERREELRLEAELQRLKLLHAGLMEREQQQRRWIHRNAVYRELLVRTVRMTKFEDVQRLTGHIGSLLKFQDDFYKRENQVHGQVEQLKESLLTLEDDHCLLQLQSNHQLSQLQSQIEKMRSEALSWERQWNHIQETAAKKTLLLGRIKMATFNLYEMADAMVEGEHTLTMNDTEKQLEKVQMYIRDYEGLVKY